VVRKKTFRERPATGSKESLSRSKDEDFSDGNSGDLALWAGLAGDATKLAKSEAIGLDVKLDSSEVPSANITDKKLSRAERLARVDSELKKIEKISEKIVDYQGYRVETYLHGGVYHATEGLTDRERSASTASELFLDWADQEYWKLKVERKKIENEGKSELVERFSAVLLELEKYSDELDDKITLDQRWNLAKATDVHEATATQAGWTSSVGAMKHSRELREILLMTLGHVSKVKDLALRDRLQRETEAELDLVDDLERKACGDLYGAYLYLSGGAETPVSTVFDKDACDDEMELEFGSLDKEGSEIDRDRAEALFSRYLARKVWVPTSWRKLQKAGSSFLSRVCDNPIKVSVNERAREIACRILALIMEDESYEDFVKRQYIPESGCVEASKASGGKRFFNKIKGRRYIKKYVVPASIYTGGKIRTITKDSAENVRHVWVCKYLNHCFSQLDCSIFGGQVSQWWEKNRGRMNYGKFAFVSGDLEAATDNFDGRITDSLLDTFCEITRYPHAEELKSFTTRCLFKVGHGKTARFYKQTRGQMMGSVVSFPLLCILSLTAYLYQSSDEHLWGKILADKKSLKNLKGVGINGDDVVFQESKYTSSKGWRKGVEAIGGIVSPGKSLRNRRYFTVNSELWDAKKGEKVNVLRPSLLTALTGDNRYFINPQIEWKEYRTCLDENPYITKKAERVWAITEKLSLDIPISLGGLGIVKGKRDKNGNLEPDLVSRLSAAYERTCNAKRNRLPTIGTDEFEKKVLGRKDDLIMGAKRYPCFVTRDSLAAFRSTYADLEGGWQMSLNEARSLARAVVGADQRIIESFPEALKNLAFYQYAPPLSSKDLPPFDLSLYEDFMNGMVLTKLPLALMGPLYARQTEKMEKALVNSLCEEAYSSAYDDDGRRIHSDEELEDYSTLLHLAIGKRKKEWRVDERANERKCIKRWKALVRTALVV